MIWHSLGLLLPMFQVRSAQPATLQEHGSNEPHPILAPTLQNRGTLDPSSARPKTLKLVNPEPLTLGTEPWDCV